MAINLLRRRLLLAGSAAAIGVVAWWRPRPGGELLLAAGDDARGRHFIAAIDSAGKSRFRLPVQHRAHAIAVLPDRKRAVFFARRPGTVSYVVDLEAGAMLGTLTSPPGRHFYGHGALGADGLLYTSENDYADARGVIGVWDPADAGMRRVGEFGSGATGPHELAFLGDGKTLAVANGGIATHPGRAREKLNIPTMQPSLTYIDTTAARVIESYRPDDHLMSLRHLAVTASDQVVIGVQYEGDEHGIVPLMLSHSGENSLTPGQADPAAWRSHGNYIASVAASNDGRHALLTAPRGATASVWDLRTLTRVTQWPLRDVAGAAASGPGDFVFSSGTGRMLRAQPSASPENIASGDLRWDNHLLTV